MNPYSRWGWRWRDSGAFHTNNRGVGKPKQWLRRSEQAWSRTVTNTKARKINTKTLRWRGFTITHNKLKISSMTNHDRSATKRSYRKDVMPCARRVVNSDQNKEITVEVRNITQLKGVRHDKTQVLKPQQLKSTHDFHGSCRTAQRANANVWTRLIQGLGLTRIYITSAWPRNFHMATVIYSCSGSNFHSHLRSIITNYYPFKCFNQQHIQL